LTLGIKAAQYDKLIMTDGDCLPNSPHWLSEIMGAYQDGVEIVLGYSPYMKEKGFLNKLIRFETAHTAMSYLSYALRRDAYMGVGCNLSYHKSLLFAGKVFTSHMHIKSGDDDLFVIQYVSMNNVRISLHPVTHMLFVPKNTWIT